VRVPPAGQVQQQDIAVGLLSGPPGTSRQRRLLALREERTVGQPTAFPAFYQGRCQADIDNLEPPYLWVVAWQVKVGVLGVSA